MCRVRLGFASCLNLVQLCKKARVYPPQGFAPGQSLIALPLTRLPREGVITTLLKTPPLAPPRTRGEARVHIGAGPQGRSVIRQLRQAGALKLIFPTVHRKDAEAVIVNTAGGVTGGDRLVLQAEVDPQAELTITTQAAERIYRAQPGEVGRIGTTLTVADGARLNWMPQETILFDHAALQRHLRIDLAGSAEVLMVEPLVFGRAAMGEVIHAVHFRDHVRLTREGKPLYTDGIRFDGDLDAHLARPAIAAGAGAMATVVLVSAQAQVPLPAVRAILPATGGASLLAPDVLVIRLLAVDGFELRRALIPILLELNAGKLPLSWRL